MHNGYPVAAVTTHGATKLGIHRLRSGIVTRGVLIDVPSVRGVEVLEPGEPIFVEDLEAAEAQAGITVRRADALFVRTGRWRWRALHGAWVPRERLAGLDASCLEWLHEREISVLGSDGVSDVLPSRVDTMRLPIHSVAIVAIGVHLLDNLRLRGTVPGVWGIEPVGLPARRRSADLGTGDCVTSEPHRHLLAEPLDR